MSKHVQSELQPLAGKVALVTGGSRNIGRAIALRLAHGGASVAVIGKSDLESAESVAAEITAAGGQAHAQLADIGDEADVAALLESVNAALGGVDILVNNAALRRPQALESMSLAQWREVMNVTLDGPFLCARACLPHMIAAGGGVIVNIGGLSAYAGGRERAHVIAAKAGLAGLTRALAIEFADRGIRANTVAPGVIDTVRGATAAAPPAHVGHGETPLGRLGRPEEVAAAVYHLCLPDSAFITGQTIHVNGGRFLA
ncbi:MAG: 3-oxoacyl-ACP reductase FabG [Gammaproteobacteria bacterium]|nr:3-oxoacyl-ACP reductase FabG [Gammaproteobacteria bacterium]